MSIVRTEEPPRCAVPVITPKEAPEAQHEREQLAFDIHDTLAQSFTGIAYQLQAARAESNGEQAVQRHIEDALQMVKISHCTASRLIASFRPHHRDALGIVEALKEQAERLSTGGRPHSTNIPQRSPGCLPEEVAESLFRIGQEVVGNAIQDGECRMLSLDLQVSRKTATLSVCDSGTGDSDWTAEAEEILSAVRMVSRGRQAFPERIKQRLTENHMTAGLSPREL